MDMNRPMYGIISHWDLDHYRVLLNMTSSQINMIQSLLVPSKMPNTLSVKNTLNLLGTHKVPIEVLGPAFKTGRYIELVSLGMKNGIEVYRSTDGKNINQSGIALCVNGKKSTGGLTGDHHYRQLNNSVFSSCAEQQYTMVVPHHGGQAGVFKEDYWNSINFKGGAISTKSGRYRNLPRDNIHKFFRNKSFHCTNCTKSDYWTNL